MPHNPPGHSNYRPRVFCPNCGALVVESHITRQHDLDEWIWFGDNAVLNAERSLPPSAIVYWGRSIPRQFLPYYDEHRLDIEKIKRLKTEKEPRVEAEGKLDWKQPFEKAFGFIKEGNIKKALEMIQKAVTAGLPKREHALALGFIGEHYLVNEKDVDSALKYSLSSVETHFSGYWQAHFYLALIYEAMGNNQKAKKEYRDAQRAEPNKSLIPSYEQKVRQIIRSWSFARKHR